MLSKWLATQPRVLILDEPTQGIDVADKAEVHAMIADLAQQGIAIILISSEMPELLGMCDRIVVLREGRLTRAFRPRRGRPGARHPRRDRCGPRRAGPRCRRRPRRVAAAEEPRTRSRPAGRRIAGAAASSASPAPSRWWPSRSRSSTRACSAPTNLTARRMDAALLMIVAAGADAGPAHAQHRPLGRLGHRPCGLWRGELHAPSSRRPVLARRRRRVRRSGSPAGCSTASS